MTRTLLAGILISLLTITPASGQSGFGTWRGVYTPTEKFTGNGDPFGSPPYDPIDMELILHGLNPGTGLYGVVNFGSGTSGEFVHGGNVITFSQNANDLTLTTFVPQEGDPTGYIDLAALVTGNTMMGTFNARSPAAPGWVHLRGPFSLSRVAVPEPSTWALAALSAGALGRRSKTKT